ERYALVLERGQRVDVAKGADDALDPLDSLPGRVPHLVPEPGPTLVAIQDNNGLRLHTLVFRLPVQLDPVRTVQKGLKGKRPILVDDGLALDLTSARGELAEFRLPPGRLDPPVKQGPEVGRIAGPGRSRPGRRGRFRRRGTNGGRLRRRRGVQGP